MTVNRIDELLAEIARLRDEIADRDAEVENLRAERDALRIQTRPTHSRDADAFIEEHYPDCAESSDGRRAHFCRGCSKAVGDYVNWPCADVWAAAERAGS